MHFVWCIDSQHSTRVYSCFGISLSAVLPLLLSSHLQSRLWMPRLALAGASTAPSSLLTNPPPLGIVRGESMELELHDALADLMGSVSRGPPTRRRVGMLNNIRAYVSAPRRRSACLFVCCLFGLLPHSTR